MIYTANNCQPGTTVFDVEGRETLRHVLSVDTRAGVVTCAHQPIRAKPGDAEEIDTFDVRFRSIYPIRGCDLWPWLFHCYGREVS